MAKLLMFLPPVVFAGLAALFYVGMQRDDPTSLPSVFIGKQAPVVPTEPLQGYAALTDADLRSGEVTLVNFWASWCPPCRAEHPTLTRLAAEGVRIVGVNMMDDPDNARAFLEEDGNPFLAIGADPKGRFRIEWGVTAPPETFIVNGEGVIVYKFIGPLIGSDLEQRFMPELRKAQAAEPSG